MLLHGATIFDYCERGHDAAFWAEPLNAVTNGAFILAALAGIIMLARRPAASRSLWHWFFVANFVAIGAGSFLFHTVPNISTVKADTGPIGVFMLTYLIFALRRFAFLSWFLTAAAIAAFIGAMAVAFNIQCWDGRIGFLLDNVPESARAKCLNGSLGYAPALAAMVLIGGFLTLKRHPGAPILLSAAAVFTLSLACRSFDQRLCAEWIVMGHRMGTHFLWHILNALTLFMLLVGAIRYGGARQEILPPRPKARHPAFAA